MPVLTLRLNEPRLCVHYRRSCARTTIRKITEIGRVTPVNSPPENSKPAGPIRRRLELACLPIASQLIVGRAFFRIPRLHTPHPLP
jgi:hypothetical protein